MIPFLIGLFIGANFGLLVAALLFAARDNDERDDLNDAWVRFDRDGNRIAHYVPYPKDDQWG